MKTTKKPFTFYSLVCTCGCENPLIFTQNSDKSQFIPIFPSKELAEIRANELLAGKKKEHPRVVEFIVLQK